MNFVLSHQPQYLFSTLLVFQSQAKRSANYRAYMVAWTHIHGPHDARCPQIGAINCVIGNAVPIGEVLVMENGGMVILLHSLCSCFNFEGDTRGMFKFLHMQMLG